MIKLRNNYKWLTYWRMHLMRNVLTINVFKSKFFLSWNLWHSAAQGPRSFSVGVLPACAHPFLPQYRRYHWEQRMNMPATISRDYCPPSNQIKQLPTAHISFK